MYYEFKFEYLLDACLATCDQKRRSLTKSSGTYPPKTIPVKKWLAIFIFAQATSPLTFYMARGDDG